MRRPVVLFVCLLLWFASRAGAVEKELPAVQPGQVRREPVAAVFWSDKVAAIACAKSGTLIVWDVNRGEIKQEFAVGRQLRGVARIGNDELLAIDDKTHELIHLRYAEEKLTELSRNRVPEFPISMAAFAVEGVKHVAVASLWSRKVTIWKRAASTSAAAMKLTHEIDLPFEPRQLAISTHRVEKIGGPLETNLLVAAAFSGDVAWIHPATGQAETKSYDLHNIGGIAYQPERGRILFSHQTLDQSVAITAEQLAAGGVINNWLTETSIGGGGVARIPILQQFKPSIAAKNGDPSGIGLTPNRVLVALAGVDEVWLSTPLGGAVQRVAVGQRPRFIATRGHQALVLGELNDSVSLIDTTDFASLQVQTSLLDPALADRELSPAERGERLFFSAKNSVGQRMSCHSCHPDGHTNGLLADTLGDNTHGTPKRVLTLRGTRLTDLWAWNGEMKSLQDNVHKSLRETMHAPQIKPADVDDLVSFLHTLPPVPPLKPLPKDTVDAAQLARGKKIFLRERCDRCHVPPLTFTSHDAYDVGIADEKGLKKFNPPSLRGVGRLPKLFHDNRADSLRDVFETHGHQLADPLPAGELADLVRFLESL